MQMKAMRIAALTASLMIGTAVAASAQATPGTTPERPNAAGTEMRHGGPGRHGGNGMRGLFRGIQLSADQQARIKTIREKYRPQMQALRQDRQAGERPDSATMSKARGLMEQQHTEIRAVLTPDQQRTFDDNVAKMRERGRDWRNARQRGDRESADTTRR
jgi:periplasmic protein CpxP/Spy